MLATTEIHNLKVYSKTVLWFSPMHKEGNKLCIIYPLINGSVL